MLAALAAVFAAAGPAATADSYAALGDSYSSGVGTGSYTLDSACKRSVYAYPYLCTQKHAGYVADVRRVLRREDIRPARDADPGGDERDDARDDDDRRERHRLREPHLPVHARDCSAALDSTRANLETTLGAALDQVYTTVKSRAAFGAKIIVLGYPRVFSGASCFGTLGISSTEQTKANALSDALDQVIATHAAADGVTYKSAIGGVHRARRLLVEPMAERAQPVQHRRELPPEPKRARLRLPAARHRRYRLAPAAALLTRLCHPGPAPSVRPWDRVPLPDQVP